MQTGFSDYNVLTMKARIVRVGNSHGIRIPKSVLEQMGLGGESEVELEVEDNRLIIQPAERPRVGWDQAFAAMAEAGDDRLEDNWPPSRFDEEEWEW